MKKKIIFIILLFIMSFKVTPNEWYELIEIYIKVESCEWQKFKCEPSPIILNLDCNNCIITIYTNTIQKIYYDFFDEEILLNKCLKLYGYAKDINGEKIILSLYFDKKKLVFLQIEYPLFKYMYKFKNY